MNDYVGMFKNLAKQAVERKKQRDEILSEYAGKEKISYLNTLAEKPDEFEFDDSKLKEYRDKYLNRKDFSFNLDGNVLYQQLKDKYSKQGQLAMMDSTGQAATLSGGYANSYGQTVGQQVYQSSLDKLADMVPQLYEMALNQHQLEGEDIFSKYTVAADEREAAYEKYRDSFNDWQEQRNFDYERYADEYDRQYQTERDEQSDEQWREEFNYGKERDENADEQWQEEFDYGKERDEKADEQWQAELDEAARQHNENLEEEKRQFNSSSSSSGSRNPRTTSIPSTYKEESNQEETPDKISVDELAPGAKYLYDKIETSTDINYLSGLSELIIDSKENGEISEEEAVYLLELIDSRLEGV